MATRNEWQHPVDAPVWFEGAEPTFETQAPSWEVMKQAPLDDVVVSRSRKRTATAVSVWLGITVAALLAELITGSAHFASAGLAIFTVVLAAVFTAQDRAVVMTPDGLSVRVGNKREIEWCDVRAVRYSKSRPVRGVDVFGEFVIVENGGRDVWIDADDLSMSADDLISAITERAVRWGGRPRPDQGLR